MPKTVRSPRVLSDEVMVTMRDGVRLSTDVVVPDDGEQHPVMLVRTCYGKMGGRSYYDAIGLARNGWVYVGQDTRGRLASEGEFRPFVDDVADGRDTVDWCAKQPWSNGVVAMMGASYVGSTVWTAALGGSKALKAISPMVASPDIRDSWLWDGGTFQHSFGSTWGFNMAMTDPATPAKDKRLIEKLTSDWPAFFTRPFPDPDMLRLNPWYAKWIDYADHDYWRSIDARRGMRRMDVAGFHIGGWYDGFVEGTIEGYTGLRAKAPTEYARESQRLIIGPWAHGTTWVPVLPQVDYGMRAAGVKYLIEMSAHLRNGVERKPTNRGASVFLMGRNTWLELPDWPPPSEPTRLFLDDGRLDWQSGAAGADSWRHDPATPVPTRGGRALLAGVPMPGPEDQRALDGRPDVVSYTGERLTRDLTIVGLVTADIVLTSSAPRTDLHVRLIDVHPDGRALSVLDGVQRVDVTPGRATTVKVTLGSTAMTFLRGHRLRVDIASSSWPRCDLMPAADQTVHRGGRRPSFLTLPVMLDRRVH